MAKLRGLVFLCTILAVLIVQIDSKDTTNFSYHGKKAGEKLGGYNASLEAREAMMVVLLLNRFPFWASVHKNQLHLVFIGNIHDNR